MVEPRNLRKTFDSNFDEAKGEIRVHGRRFTTIDLVELCRHLDSLVGEKIAAVIAETHGRETGKDDLTNIRENNPNATFEKIIEALIAGGVRGGHGIAKLTTSEDETTPISLEILNPVVQASTGTCLKLVLAYWEEALSELLGKTLDKTGVSYEASKNILKCRFTVVGIPETK